MKKKPDTIQHTCGFPEPTENDMWGLTREVDAGFRHAYAKKGRKMPKISSCEIGALSVEALEMIEAY